MELVSEGALDDGRHRIVVASVHGRFEARPPALVTAEGEWVERGQVLGEIRTRDRDIPVESSCRGWLMGYLARDGDRVRPGTPLVHVEAE